MRDFSQRQPQDVFFHDSSSLCSVQVALPWILIVALPVNQSQTYRNYLTIQGSQVLPLTGGRGEVSPVTEVSPLREVGREVGPLTEVGREVGPLTEVGEEVGPLTEVGREVGPLTEVGREVGPLPEVGREVGPLTEVGREVGPLFVYLQQTCHW